MNLYAVVLHWKRRDDTLAALASLRGTPAICVDNGSDDPVGELPGVEVLRLDENRGFAGGNNAGIRRALELGADWVLLLNDDATMSPGATDALTRAARDDIGVLACKIVYPDGRVQYAGARWRPWLGYSGRSRTRVRSLEVDRADGAAMAVSRAAIERAGLLDEELFLYVEDVDWSARIRRAGFRIVLVPDAVVVHKGSASTGGAASTANLYYDTRNTIAVVERHAPLPPGLRAARRLVVVGAHLAQAMAHPHRGDAARAVLAGWRDARAGRLGQRSSSR